MLITIDKILDQKDRSTYWLAKEVGCDFQSLQKLINNETSRISFDLLERVCNVLECTPNDILTINEYVTDNKKR